MAGQQPGTLRQAVRGPALRYHRDQYAAARGHRREREDVSGVPAVRVLHEPRPLDQGPAGSLHAALGVACAACVAVAALDVHRLRRISQQRVGGTLRHRWPDLVQLLLARDGSQRPRLYLEMDAILDLGIPGWPNGDSAEYL